MLRSSPLAKVRVWGARMKSPFPSTMAGRGTLNRSSELGEKEIENKGAGSQRRADGCVSIVLFSNSRIEDGVVVFQASGNARVGNGVPLREIGALDENESLGEKRLNGSAQSPACRLEVRKDSQSRWGRSWGRDRWEQ